MTEQADTDRTEESTGDEAASARQTPGAGDGHAEQPAAAPSGLITLGSSDAVACEGDTCWIPPTR